MAVLEYPFPPPPSKACDKEADGTHSTKEISSSYYKMAVFHYTYCLYGVHS